jgi:hypothetical protein
VIGYDEMNCLMRHKIAEYKLWSEDELPVEGEVSPRGAVPPLGPLSHNIQSIGTLLQARGNYRKLSFDFLASLFSKPSLKTAGDRRR